MAAKISKNSKRLKKKIRIRKKLSGTEERPRMCVFKSSKHIYAQIIDDIAGKTLAAASTLDGDFLSKFEGGDKTSKATLVGTLVAQRAFEKGIKTIVFDRGGFIYHGRIKSLADAAREAGLVF